MGSEARAPAFADLSRGEPWLEALRRRKRWRRVRRVVVRLLAWAALALAVGAAAGVAWGVWMEWQIDAILEAL